MKLYCNVEVNVRSLSGHGGRRKSVRSVLAIGRQSVKNDDLFILLQTLQNKQGTKYKVAGNIECVFTKFINDGKTTIRMKEPPHDLIIQADVVQLKSFLHVLKLGVSKQIDPNVLTISNLNPKAMNSMPKTKVVINKASDYPTLEGFPRTTQELHLAGLSRKSFDRQILRLHSLRILNLSNNKIPFLPKELGDLPSLQELHLSQNQLGKATVSKWAWLGQPSIRKSLKFLDISCNVLAELPEQIGKLDMLINLKTSTNLLTHLPQSIGNLINLKYLDVSRNALTYMPGSIKNLKLVSIDVSENVFPDSQPSVMCRISVPSLVECAARVFLKTRCPYDAKLIPYTLVRQLDQAKYCPCGTACLQCYVKKFMLLNLNKLAPTVTSSGVVIVPSECYFCSVRCINRYNKVEF